MTLPSAPIRILIVEDHPVFREGLVSILAKEADMLVVAQAESSTEAIAAYRQSRPDITLMDQRLPGATGIDTLVSIRGSDPRARIIMLTTSEGDGEIKKALSAGAAAYVLKSSPKQEILKTIRTVHAGKKHIPPDVATKLVEHLGDELLSRREIEILELIRDGRPNKQVADILGITESTVNFHMKKVFEKLQANDRVHAVTIAIRRGLISI